VARTKHNQALVNHSDNKQPRYKSTVVSQLTAAFLIRVVSTIIIPVAEISSRNTVVIITFKLRACTWYGSITCNRGMLHQSEDHSENG